MFFSVSKTFAVIAVAFVIFSSAHQYPTSEILPFSTAMCFLSAMLLHLSPPKTCNMWKAWRTLRDTCGFAMIAVEKKHSIPFKKADDIMLCF